jgi:hypothetical protein
VSLTWEQGRDTIEKLIASAALEQVPASREHADLLIAQARKHLESARVIAGTDPEGAYAMVYDAARKALTAVLENQGLRTTRLRGHHQSAYEAVVAQLVPPMGKQLRPFNRMRQTRGSAEYPKRDEPALSTEDVLEDRAKSEEIVDICAKVLDHMPVFVPR